MEEYQNIYRFVFNPNIETDEFIGPEVDSLDKAMNGLMLIADYTLFLHDQMLMPDYSNYGGVQRLDTDGDWSDLDEDELKKDGEKQC